MRPTPLLLFFFLCFAGCTDPPVDACTQIQADLSLEEVREASLLVDNGSLVLHARDATLWMDGPAGCQRITLDDIDEPLSRWRVGHDATEIAESWPAQAWPGRIVVARAG